MAQAFADAKTSALAQPLALMLLPRALLPPVAMVIARDVLASMLCPRALSQSAPISSFRCLFWLMCGCRSQADVQLAILAFSDANREVEATFLADCIPVGMEDHIRV